MRSPGGSALRAGLSRSTRGLGRLGLGSGRAGEVDVRHQGEAAASLWCRVGRRQLATNKQEISAVIRELLNLA